MIIVILELILGLFFEAPTTNFLFNILKNGSRLHVPTDSFSGLMVPLITDPTTDFNSTPEFFILNTIDSYNIKKDVPISYKLVSFSSPSLFYVNRCKGNPASNHEAGISEIIIKEIKC